MKTQAFLLLAVAALIFSAPLCAQTAQRVENLLGEPAISWSAAASFVLEAADIQAPSGNDAAFNYAQEQKWVPKKAQAGDKAKLNGISLLFMRAFKLKGGLLYSIATTPHFAYRELVFKGIISGRTDPGMTVSGDDFLYMLGRVLSVRDEEDLNRQLKEEEKLAREINAQLAASNITDTVATVTDEGVTISLSNIQFKPNSSELEESEKAKIREIARILETIPDRKLLITGHTALAGTREEQQRTSVDRARSVANFIVSLGVRKLSDITIQGFGADKPIADNTTEAGRAKNRRVEITILSENTERRGQ